jgi:hypothetical protein
MFDKYDCCLARIEFSIRRIETMSRARHGLATEGVVLFIGV